MQRNQVIVRTSIIGILANLFLAGFKAAVGVISGSIAIVLDAVNNLSDALSSVITIIGTKLAGRRPDRDHPYGHGRIEYLSATIISVIVLYAGVTSLVESIKKKLAQAEGNAPRERRAQMIANSQVKAVKQANPMMTPKDLKKYKAQAIQTARNQVGAKRSPIALTDREWEAIQSGAIGYTTLKKITKHIDDETLKGYAMPKTATFSVSPAKVQQMKAMQAAGYTTAQIGERFGVSSSSVSRYLRDGV